MKEEVLPLQCLYLILCGSGNQEYLSVETLLDVTTALEWGYEVGR